MAFKDVVNADNTRVFLNLNEFAETHNIEGRSVVCVVTEDASNRMRDGRIVAQVEGDLVVRGKTEDLHYYPEAVINVDGREYIVQRVDNAMGITELVLRQTQGM